MNGMQAAARLVDAFEEANIPYMVVGSLSSSFSFSARPILKTPGPLDNLHAASLIGDQSVLPFDGVT